MRLWGNFLRKVPPPQKLPDKKYSNSFFSLLIKGRRAPNAHFCCRERLGTSKTLSAKKVEQKQSRGEEIVLQSLGGLPPSIRSPAFVKNIIQF